MFGSGQPDAAPVEAAPPEPSISVWADSASARFVKRTALAILGAAAAFFVFGAVGAALRGDWASAAVAGFLLAFAVWILLAGWPWKLG